MILILIYISILSFIQFLFDYVCSIYIQQIKPKFLRMKRKTMDNDDTKDGEPPAKQQKVDIPKVSYYHQLQHNKRYNILFRCEWKNDNPNRKVFSLQGLIADTPENPTFITIIAHYPHDEKISAAKPQKFYLLRNVFIQFYIKTRSKIARVNQLSSNIEEVSKENLHKYEMKAELFHLNFAHLATKISEDYSSDNIDAVMVAGQLTSNPTEKMPNLWTFEITNHRNETATMNSWTQNNPLNNKIKKGDVLLFSKVIKKPWRNGFSLTISGAIYKTNWKWIIDKQPNNNLTEPKLDVNAANSLVMYIHSFIFV